MFLTSGALDSVPLASGGSPERYIVKGELLVPDGRTPLIRSVWFIETDEHVPRFVTAYPLYGRLT